MNQIVKIKIRKDSVVHDSRETVRETVRTTVLTGVVETIESKKLKDLDQLISDNIEEKEVREFLGDGGTVEELKEILDLMGSIPT